MFYIKPHNNISLEVTKKDIPIIKSIAPIMQDLCYKKYGIHTGALAIAHQQIEKDNPLRFFITKEKEIIINPIITNKKDTTFKSFEGCLSFPFFKGKIVLRYNSISVKYLTLENDNFIEKIENISGKRAFIFQHEIDHFDCIYINDIKT